MEGFEGFDHRWDEAKQEMKVVKASNSNGIFFIELTHYVRAFSVMA